MALVPRVILAAVSFSTASRVALALAALLAQQYGAELHVLHVEDPLLDAAAANLGFDLVGNTQVQLLQLIADVWPSSLITPQPHVIVGPTVDVILNVARDAQADLVVVGACGLSTAERLIFTAMPEELLKRADISVLVAPPIATPL